MRNLGRALLVAMLGAFVLIAPAPASAASRPLKTHYCTGTLHFFGSPYGYLSRGVSCRFAHDTSLRYQRHDLTPAHWSCTGNEPYTEGGSCQDRRSDASFEYYIED